MVLPRLTLLDERYAIGRVLDDFGSPDLTYQAWNLHTEEQVVIQEYFPALLARRIEGSLEVVCADAAQEASFHYGLEQFVREADVLAELDHPNLVRELGCFEAHGTAYRVVAHHAGASLASVLEQQGGPLPIQTALTLMMPLLDGLYAAHRQGLLHGAVTPKAVFLARDAGPMLRGFRTAHLLLAQHVGVQEALLEDGFSAPEQEEPDGRQGPWTDVYGCAATLFCALTGAPPPPASLRRTDDDVPVRLRQAGDLSESVRRVLEQALSLDPVERPRSMDIFQRQLVEAVEKDAAPAVEEDPAPAVEEDAVLGIEEEAVVSSTEEDPEAQSQEESAFASEQTAAFLVEEEPLVFFEEESVGWVEDEPTNSIEEESVSEREKDPVAYIEDEPVAYVEDQPARSAEEDPSVEEASLEAPSLEDIFPKETVVAYREEEPAASTEDVAARGMEAAAAALAYSETTAQETPPSLEDAVDEVESVATEALPARQAHDIVPEMPKAASPKPEPLKPEPPKPKPSKPVSSKPKPSKPSGRAGRPARPRKTRVPVLAAVAVIAIVALAGAYVVLQDDGGPITQFAHFKTEGDSLFALANYTDAQSQYEYALAAHPKDRYVAERLRETRQRLAEVGAIRYAQNLARGDSLYAEADSLLAVGQALSAAALYAEANKAYYEALKYHPNDAEMLEKGQLTTEGMNRALQINQEQALQRPPVAVEPDPETLRRQQYANYRQQGDALFDQQDITAARRKYSEALDHQPGDAYVIAKIGEIDASLATSEREEQYRQLLERGLQLCDQGRCPEARAAFQGALELQPGAPEALVGLAHADSILAGQKNQEEQYQYFRGQGDGLVSQGRYEAAISSYEQALAFKPGDDYVQQKLEESRKALKVLSEPVAEDGVYTVVDTPPRLIGGLEALGNKVRYPKPAYEQDISGRVYVQFVVDEQGAVQHPEVIRGIGGGCDEEAVRVISAARFEPGRLGDRPVKVRHTLFITFQNKR